jgi:hypothetical protein
MSVPSKQFKNFTTSPRFKIEDLTNFKGNES